MKSVLRYVGDNLGTTAWIYLVVGAMFAIFAFLLNLQNDIQIKSIIFFSITYLFCYVFLITLPFMSSVYSQRSRGSDGSRPFWLQNLQPKQLIWIPFGILGVFAVAYASLGLQNPLLGIMFSGIVMLIAFYRTHNILIPILIHGTYNAIVVFLKSGLISNSVLSVSPIPVPTIGVSLVAGSQLASEMIFQYVLVAVAEELLKMLIIAFILVNIKGSFDSKGGWKYLAGGIAVVIWSVLHLIVSLPSQ